MSALIIAGIVVAIVFYWLGKVRENPAAPAQVMKSCDSWMASRGTIERHDHGDTLPCGKKVGECTVGIMTCDNGKWTECTGKEPTSEICDSKDNNCNGLIDDGFDLQTDSENCGACGTGCKSPTGFCRNAKCVGAEVKSEKVLPTAGTIACVGSGLYRTIVIEGSISQGLGNGFYYSGNRPDSVYLAIDAGDCRIHQCFKRDLCHVDKNGFWTCQYDDVKLVINGVPRACGLRPIVNVRRIDGDLYEVPFDLTQWKIAGTCMRRGCEASCRKGEVCGLAEDAKDCSISFR